MKLQHQWPRHRKWTPRVHRRSETPARVATEGPFPAADDPSLRRAALSDRGSDVPMALPAKPSIPCPDPEHVDVLLLMRSMIEGVQHDLQARMQEDKRNFALLTHVELHLLGFLYKALGSSF